MTAGSARKRHREPLAVRSDSELSWNRPHNGDPSQPDWMTLQAGMGNAALGQALTGPGAVRQGEEAPPIRRDMGNAPNLPANTAEKSATSLNPAQPSPADRQAATAPQPATEVQTKERVGEINGTIPPALVPSDSVGTTPPEPQKEAIPKEPTHTRAVKPEKTGQPQQPIAAKPEKHPAETQASLPRSADLETKAPPSPPAVQPEQAAGETLSEGGGVPQAPDAPSPDGKAVPNAKPGQQKEDGDKDLPRAARQPKSARDSRGKAPTPAQPKERISFSGNLPQLIEQLRQVSPIRAPFVFDRFAGAYNKRVRAVRDTYAANPPSAIVRPFSKPKGKRGQGKGDGEPAKAKNPQAAMDQTAPPKPDIALNDHSGQPAHVDGAAQSAAVDRLDTENEGGFFARIRNLILRFFHAIPLSDPGVQTNPGEAPTLTLSGKADPAQIEGFRETGRKNVQTGLEGAEKARAADFGENDLIPDADPETFTANMPNNPAKNAPCNHSDVRQLNFDPQAATELDARVRAQQDPLFLAQKEKVVQGANQRDRTIEAARSKADQTVLQHHLKAYGDQSSINESTIGEVQKQQDAWGEENLRVFSDYQTDSGKQATEAESAITTKVHQENLAIRTKHTATKARADRERARVNGEAARIRNTKRKESKSWFSRGVRWVKRKAKAAFDWVAKKVRKLFRELRARIRRWFAEFKQWAIRQIERGRKWVINKLEGVRKAFHSLADRYLSRFPTVCRLFKKGIDTVVDGGKKAVNATADVLKKGVSLVIDTTATIFDKALALGEAVFFEVFDFTCAMVMTGFNIVLVLVDRDLDAVIELIRGLPETKLMGPLWPLVKYGLIGFLERLRDKPADEKKRISDKILKVALSPSYYGGYFLGVLKGFVWDGLLGLVRLALQVISFVPKAVKGIYNFFKRMLSDRESISRIIGALDQANQALQQFLARPDALEQIVSFLTRSPVLLFRLVQKALEMAPQLAHKAGAATADALFKFVLGKSAYDIGLAVGSVVGQIIFEVLATIFSGGGYLAAKAAGMVAKVVFKGVKLLFTALKRGAKLIFWGLRKLVGLVHAGFRIAKGMSPALRGFFSKLKGVFDEIVAWFAKGIRSVGGLIKRFVKKIREFAEHVFEGLGFKRYEVQVEGGWVILYGIRSKIMLARFRKDSSWEYLKNDTKLIKKLRHARATLRGKAKAALAAGKKSQGNKMRYGSAVRRSEEIGERAANRVIRTRFPTAKIAHHGSGSGTLDLVYKRSNGHFVIIEAKGGGSSLGSRKVAKGVRAQQGTVAYLRSVLKEMQKKPGQKKIADELLKALNERKLRYFLSETPITNGGKTTLTKLTEFLIPAK